MPVLTTPANITRRPRRGLAYFALAILGATLTVHVLDPLARAGGGDSSPLVPVMAILSLAAGVGLVVLAVLVALRRSLRWWRLVAVPLLAIGVFWSIIPTAMAWIATHPSRVPPTATTPATAQLQFRDLSLVSGDNTHLAAWYVPSRNGAAVIALPGALSTRAQLVPHARALAAHGYGVLLLDPRGHGDSGGRGMEYGWYGNDDVRAAVDWVLRQPDVEDGRVAILGLSMGGEQALTAAAADARIKAVVAEGATVRTYEDVRRGLSAGNVPLGVVQYRALYGLTDLLTPASPPIPLERALGDIAPRPVLLLCTESEAAYGRRQQAVAASTTVLWAPASTAHTRSLAENPNAWEERVTAFLGSALEQ